jgi:hypothetical protein
MDVYTAILVTAAVDVPKLIIKASDDTVLRYACPVPKDLQVKPFAISEQEGRTYVYDLSGVK